MLSNRFEIYTKVNIHILMFLGYNTMQSGRLMHLYIYIYIYIYLFCMQSAECLV
jgi:hypothetical protein